MVIILSSRPLTIIPKFQIRIQESPLLSTIT
jgi:hypothetical protein